ncbi:glutaredoxin family protein [Caldibacillus thermolactis]|jgi:glutaredoxin 3|uniref:Glutaredoxin family protein n=1 Tax=Pallidibacillus thermolactis TaxID=251051 RepID=A0ABT2WH43_9BACI|nr:glutaredoxin family protein [Pallidibacillus thermolactis]MCU9595014.1 glutaredoxin family protein [Pallidibacillus thermolactis]MED1673515.1 glutaredoxin family protein [Pallidibacillus thermolactis subsp. kokeshiiformis]
MNQKVTVYTTTMCPVCKMVKNFLNLNDISYEEVNLEIHPIAMVKLISKTGKFTVPQTNINGKWISGFDPVGLLKAIQV